jgi:16S rRNA (cytidine1402-2'-O)-methyltransferase
MMGIVYLIPSPLHDGGLKAIPSAILAAVKDCQVFFVENERSARRYLKSLWKEISIDAYEWYVMDKASNHRELSSTFGKKLNEGKNIGILSEAGCPGIADPGQILVSRAQELNADIRPLIGPNSILLALMASGMNGQHFQFLGYLPIDPQLRAKKIKELEEESQKKNCTQVFIETPYRNNQLIESLLKNCRPSTRLCIAVDLTSDKESIKTKLISAWKESIPNIHKLPSIFLIYAGELDDH